MATGISTNQSKVFGVNDVTTGILEFKNKVQGSIQLSFNGNESKDELVIIGSEGTMKLSIMSNDNLIVTKNDKTYEFSFDAMEHVQMPYIKRVVDTLLGKDNYDATGIYGLKTQEVLEAFENSRTIKKTLRKY